jgi:uncharacterized hydantoinase/oxoprolinase family protein
MRSWRISGTVATKQERGYGMNLKILHEVVTTSPRAITDLAERRGLDTVVAMGTAKLLLANDGNLASLSPKQRQHFDLAIAPLLG